MTGHVEIENFSGFRIERKRKEGRGKGKEGERKEKVFLEIPEWLSE